MNRYVEKFKAFTAGYHSFKEISPFVCRVHLSINNLTKNKNN